MLKTAFVALIATISATSCVVGAPPGFSDGDEWTAPLIAPLENDIYLVPVSINGKGPFVFMVDPDSPTSAIEASLQAGLKLYASRQATQAQTEEDHLVRIVLAEIRELELGTLTVRNMKARVFDDATFWAGGRRVRGLLGRDVISDSLIYSFDRDQGIMRIATQGNLKVPEGTPSLKFTQSYSQHRRYLGKAKINQSHNVTMHLDLGARTSMLWPALLKKYKLPQLPVDAEVVDEYGIRRQISSGNMAGLVQANDVEVDSVLMLPYGDKRLEPEDLDGILGQNFWSKFNVTVNWHKKRFWMQPRSKVTAFTQQRLDRWGALNDCEQPACVRLERAQSTAPAPVTPAGPDPSVPVDETGAAVEPGTGASDPAAAADPAVAPAPAEPTPFTSLVITREQPGSEFAYDVLLAAVDSNGDIMPAPFLLASFGAKVSTLAVPQLAPAYHGASKFIVLDMDPVGMRGFTGGTCVYQIPH
jgi:hypothetical protein